MQFDNKSLNKKLFRIASPIAIQGIVTATLTMIDNLMVGFLGETELAAVGVAGQLFMVHYMLLFGILSGSATFMAQFYGTRDMANIRKVIGFAFTLLSGLGILFFVLANCLTDGVLSIYSSDPSVKDLAATYVRINSFSFLLLAFSAPMEMAFKATQQVRLPMIVSAAVFISNVTINYLLIFGKLGFPKLGVAGAAIGTLAARLVEVTLNTVFAFRQGNPFKGSIQSFFGWDPELVKRVIKNATPTTLNEFFWGFGQTMYVAAFTRIGTTAYAAYQAANSLFNIFNFASFSVGDAALILIGEKLGEGDKEYTWMLAKHILKVAVCVGLAFGAMTIVLAKPLSLVFNLTDQGKTFTFYILIVFGATMVFDLLNGVLIAGVLRAGGDTRFAMLTECGSIWLIAVPLAFISALVWHMPIHFALLMTRIESVIKAAILLKRFESKKWMNTVIEDL